MRYIILTLTLLFSLSSYSQDEKTREFEFIKTSGSTGNFECEHDFEELSFNYLPESFFGSVDGFYIDSFCPGYLTVSTFDGKYTVNFDSAEDEWAKNLKSSYYDVRNKYDLIIESFTPASESAFILDKYYENGRLMLAGSLEKIEKRKRSKIQPRDKWYLLSENGKYIMVGFPKFNSYDNLLNWRIFKNENIEIINKLRDDYLEVLLEEGFKIVSPKLMAFPILEIIDEGEVYEFELNDNFINKEMNLSYKLFPSSYSYFYDDINNTLLNEKNGYVLVENGDKIKLLDAYNKLNSMND